MVCIVSFEFYIYFKPNINFMEIFHRTTPPKRNYKSNRFRTGIWWILKIYTQDNTIQLYDIQNVLMFILTAPLSFLFTYIFQFYLFKQQVLYFLFYTCFSFFTSSKLSINCVIKFYIPNSVLVSMGAEKKYRRSLKVIWIWP